MTATTIRPVAGVLLLQMILNGCGGSGGSGDASGADATGAQQQDTTPPEITLVGDSVMSHEQGTSFVDPGATATDAGNPIEVVTLGSVGSAADTYILTYEATDAAGNTATATRTVTVADTVAPVIIVIGETSVTVPSDTIYVDAGASATDRVDGAITVTESGTVGTSAGTYTLMYTAIDTAGNSATATRTVIVEDVGGVVPGGGSGGVPGEFQVTHYGAGNISDAINPASFRCDVDFGNWIYNAGVVQPAIEACDAASGIPTGTPVDLFPQLTGAAADKPTQTHRWWGSVSFLGEMRVGDANAAAYITPDPFTVRITEKGIRALGIPSGLKVVGNGFGYPIPSPAAEVFDGIAIGNSIYSNLDAYLKDYSDGAITVEWRSGNQPVMEATFVHGSPYIYFKAYAGDLEIRTLRSDGGEKGIFFNEGNSLGIWTNVAGNRNNYLVTGEGATEFGNVEGNVITVGNATKALTLTYLPETAGNPTDAMTTFFASYARNVVAAVRIDYSIDRSDNTVTVSHEYLDEFGTPVQTIAGLSPLHWKNSVQPTSGYQVRSARGTTKFSQSDGFSYTLPSIGVLPTLPTEAGDLNEEALAQLINEFIAQGESSWNTYTDTYWSGKNYGKVAELIAIADSIGMDSEARRMLNWLQFELADWFTAASNGSLDVNKYFVYDETWNTLLGLDESFASHQQLNDHHFHYGYFIRAAAEVCRLDPGWCADDRYGPMIELLIRDFAGGRDDPMFPYLRNFDPANGFSWASGHANFARGNNNESTSEAANAYGAIVLYGLVTGQDDLVDRGMYLHASTAAAYWEYWNNIDRYNNVNSVSDNFPAGYNRITTSIVWGDGSAFATWFSNAVAHILGIQGLPANPLILHVGLHSDYMLDYVNLGLSESSNLRPSGLPPDQWRDLWWNLWAMADAEAAIADYNTVVEYIPEAGESQAHTYHWLHVLAGLGQMKTGTGELTSDYPAALAFEKDGVTSYVVYNFGPTSRIVTYSDGQRVNAVPFGFSITRN